MTLAFFEAVRRGEREAVVEMLTSDPSLARTQTEEGLSAVLLAAYHQEPEIARLLAERRDDLTIFEAAAVGDVNAIAWLVGAQPARINSAAADGFSPLGLASFFGHLEAAHILIERGAEVNQAADNPMRVMPLHSAVAGHHLEIARLLLEHGALVNAAQQDGFTPLHGAAQNGQVAMVELLLKYGADPELTNKEGKTPLAIARDFGQQATVDLLGGRAGQA